MHRELDISTDVRARIGELIAYAEARPISLETMRTNALRYAAGETDPAPEFTIAIPTGWRVSYMIETHQIAVLRRLRVALDRPNVRPPPEAMRLLIEEFGFRNALDKIIILPELLPDGFEASNAMEPVSVTMEDFGLRLARLADAQETLCQ